MGDGATILITVKTEVAPIKLGQINPSKVFHKALNTRFNTLITCEGVTNVLNLDNFAASPELASIETDLGNGSAVQLLWSSLDNKLNEKSCPQINGIKLSNNNLQYFPGPITNLQRTKFQLMDLRNNKVGLVDGTLSPICGSLMPIFFINNCR